MEFTCLWHNKQPTSRVPKSQFPSKSMTTSWNVPNKFLFTVHPGSNNFSGGIYNGIQKKSKVTFLLILKHFMIQMNVKLFLFNGHLWPYLNFTIHLIFKIFVDFYNSIQINWANSTWNCSWYLNNKVDIYVGFQFTLGNLQTTLFLPMQLWIKIAQ